jgi:hypothetical protein
MNKPVDVICGECDEAVGRAFPDNAEGVFRAHLEAVHPKLSRTLKMTEDPRSIHIPWPPKTEAGN